MSRPRQCSLDPSPTLKSPHSHNVHVPSMPCICFLQTLSIIMPHMPSDPAPAFGSLGKVETNFNQSLERIMTVNQPNTFTNRIRKDGPFARAVSQ
jgi:hypothetical protein